MSLTSLLRSPMKLFAKDVITFFKIRRYDLDKEDNTLHYISVKKTASIHVLRQKIWFILDLPDYCEELIILKTDEEVEVPLTELRKGNNPQHPYVLEVWLPGKRMYCSSTTVVDPRGCNMLTMGRGELDVDSETECTTTVSVDSEVYQAKTKSICSAERKFRRDPNRKNHDAFKDYPRNIHRKQDLISRVSSTSLFFKLHSRKSRDNFTNILLKIQNDLSTLSNKLSNLEERIPA